METGDQYRGNFREIQKAPAIWGGGCKLDQAGRAISLKAYKKGAAPYPGGGIQGH